MRLYTFLVKIQKVNHHTQWVINLRWIYIPFYPSQATVTDNQTHTPCHAQMIDIFSIPVIWLAGTNCIETWHDQLEKTCNNMVVAHSKVRAMIIAVWCANTHCIMNKSTCSQEHRGDTMLHHTCSMAWRLSQSMWDSLSSSQCYNRYITLLTRSLPGQRVWWKRWLEWRTVLSSLAHSVDEPSLRHYPTLPDNHSLHLALSPPTGVCLLTGPLVVLQVERNSWNELLLLALERV